MKLVNLLFAVVGAVLVTAVAVTEPAHAITVWDFSCDGEQVFTWQAVVTDSTGNPIPAGDYQLIYCYYEDSSGMDLIGCCTTYATVGSSKRGLKSGIAAAGGLAKAMLNYAQPIWEDTFMVGRAPRLPAPGHPYPWLEVSFEGETMSPLTRITGVPDAGTSRRMRGDFYSAKGRAMIINDSLVTSGIVDLVTNSSTATLALYSSNEDSLPRMTMEATDSGSTVTLLDMTGNARISLTGEGAGTLDGLVWSKTGFKFPDGSVQTTAATGGACRWTVTNSVLFTNDYWGIARGGAGNILDGDSVRTMVNLGVACTTGFDFLTGNYLTVSGGFGNRAGTDYSTVGGGRQNAAYGSGSTISGGEQNSANGWRSTVGGGASNTIHGRYCGISSGYSNLAGDEVLDTAAYVGGGYNNSATAKYSCVGGGFQNQASDTFATVSGGGSNSASGYRSTVGGGYGNEASEYASTVGGGDLNDANGSSSTVSGGRLNSADGSASTVSGGYYNQAAGDYSVVPGGRWDTLTSSADYSMAFGRYVYVNTSYRVVFFDSASSGRLGLNRDDHDSAGIGHPIHVGTNTSNGNGAYLSGGGTWTNGSSREFKENFQRLDGQDVLNRIDKLPMESWEYKGTGERHIWPCAEDFHEQFDVGVIKEDGTRDNEYLAAGDVAGVALAGVKQLAKENRELRERIVQLEALVEALLAQQDGSNEPKAEFGMNK